MTQIDRFNLSISKTALPFGLLIRTFGHVTYGLATEIQMEKAHPEY